ncbi:hypothetical protein ACFL35_09120 [Candidatus Riflebacteria bacterium]
MRSNNSLITSDFYISIKKKNTEFIFLACRFFFALVLFLCLSAPLLQAGNYAVTVSGLVLQEGGHIPISLVTVTARFPYHAGSEVKATTDSSGRFSIVLPHTGRWFFGYAKMDYETISWSSQQAKQINLFPHHNGGHLNLETARLRSSMGSIWGYVQEAGNIPIANADIQVDGIHYTYTDYKGHFNVIRQRPGMHTIAALPSGFKSKIKNVIVAANIQSNIHFTFYKEPTPVYPATIQGKLVYPVESIEFLKKVMGFNRMKVLIPTAVNPNIQMSYNETGYFEIKNLKASETHQLRFETPGFTQNSGNASSITLKPGVNIFPDVNMTPIYTNISGSVRNSTGSPADNGIVHWFQLSKNANINSSGNFRIENVFTGYLLEFKASTRVASGTTLVTETYRNSIVPDPVPEIVLNTITTRPGGIGLLQETWEQYKLLQDSKTSLNGERIQEKESELFRLRKELGILGRENLQKGIFDMEIQKLPQDLQEFLFYQQKFEDLYQQKQR